ncbi:MULTISPECIES: hypothetical protein [Mycobacterium]|uniref:hypothetical protein n=1 Tax=Mycobacterium TaxID=1763 RepID=UPI001CDA01B5|nr:MULTISPECIES: hypothetical protein [Mycobacterium]MCA2242414.1 hypothetical protein [Mycobacterium sp. WUMAC-067]MCA2313799.1 hypothetical protein [Mycobacterium sp. WUMAC-025]MEE3755093.1 hypothetical protein [Mycobacterium intracellulare]
MKTLARSAATISAIAGLGLAGLGVAIDAQARPGPFPQWCPGDFWDPGWGDNWDTGNCHDNWRGSGPNPYLNPGGPGGPGGLGGPGGPGGGGPGGGGHGGGGGH